MTTYAPSYAIPAQPANVPCWLGRGMRLCVQGVDIDSPYVFAGRRLGGPWCAAVDLELPARLEGLAARPGASAYAHLAARQRHAFIEWLVSGRRGKVTDAAVLVAFLAGAEQFLLDDSLGRTPADEADLLAELQVLADYYRSAHPEQAGQCLALRDYAWVRRQARLATPAWGAPDFAQLAGMPASLALRWVVGDLLARGEPLPAKVAYQLARTHLTSMAVRRLPLFEVQFERLFLQRFAERFGKGIAAPDSTLVSEPVAYSAVGAPLYGQRCRLSRQAPMLMSSGTLRQRLSDLTATCMGELQDYIAVRMDGTPDDAAWSKLPVCLWPARPRSAFRALVAQALNSPTAVHFEQVAPYFVAGPTLAEKNLVRVAAGLAQVGLASYPPLPHDKPATARTPFILYAADSPAPPTRLADPAGDAFEMALRLAKLGCPAPQDDEPGADAGTGGTLALPALFERMATRVLADEAVTPALRRCRWAALYWAQTGAAKGVTRAQWSKLPAEAQQAALDMLAHLLAPLPELPATPQLDKLLGAPWVALKARPFQLDSARVQQLTAETGAVHQLLGTLFEGEPAPEGQAPGSPASPAGAVSLASSAAPAAPSAGPGAARLAFLRFLANLTTLPAAQLQQQASSLALMPEGTVEWANELAYDVAGQPVLEEAGDNWLVAPDVVAELLQYLAREVAP